MAETKALTPIEQKSVEFYGDDLTAVRANDGRIYTGLTQMCSALGLNARGQSQRVDRHTVLSRGKGVCKIHSPGQQPINQQTKVCDCILMYTRLGIKGHVSCFTIEGSNPL
jgi:hypothetical protein